MLSIGAFSKICRVSTKTLRYYAEIGLLEPKEINPENGYRYYSIDQLETMLYINRLKTYHFSLEEIKVLFMSEETHEDVLSAALFQKKKEIEQQLKSAEQTLSQLNEDIHCIDQGKSIMSYLDDIHVELVTIPKMSILSIRKNVHAGDMSNAYSRSFGNLMSKIANHNLTITAPPMVLFHSAEFRPNGLDIEFAIPIKEGILGTREFQPDVCLHTTVYGSYSQLPSVYAKQCAWAQKEGYIGNDALYEVYVNDPTVKETELITEVYYPVKKDV